MSNDLDDLASAFNQGFVPHQRQSTTLSHQPVPSSTRGSTMSSQPDTGPNLNGGGGGSGSLESPTKPSQDGPGNNPTSSGSYTVWQKAEADRILSCNPKDWYAIIGLDSRQGHSNEVVDLAYAKTLQSVDPDKNLYEKARQAFESEYKTL